MRALTRISNMTVRLINPRDYTARHEDTEYFYNTRNLPHSGTEYITAVLKQNHLPVSLIECMHEGLETGDVLNQIAAGRFIYQPEQIYNSIRAGVAIPAG